MADENATVAALLDVRKLFEDAAAKPRRIEVVDVPFFGKVHVKGLTADEYDDYESGTVHREGDELVRKPSRARLLRLCVVTEAGTKVFKDEHIEMLGNLDSSIVVPIAQKALELCGHGAKAEEDTAKN